jgi:DNA-binding SARP family transcriptional activator
MTDVTFGLIGPLDVRWAGQSIVVPAARQRMLLAALLLRANQPVPKRRLCAALWDDHPTERAETTLRSYVMRLRRALGPGIATRLSAQPSGYLLRLEHDDEFDVLRLQACIKQGKDAAGAEDWECSMRAFRAGLALWRGEPLCDVPSDYLHLSFTPVLTELRAQVWEGLCAAARRLGRTDELLLPLQHLIEDDPLNERFSVLFMTALAECNRRLDALAEYRRLRAALVHGHGVEPASSARELHGELLRDEPTTAGAERHQNRRQITTRAASGLVPQQLPCGARVFVGRDREVGELVRYLTAAPDGGDAPPVAAITGFPGIGKTELAIAVAHRVAGHYPDGQLYADLRGSTANPVTSGRILAQFLRALGVDGRSVARDSAERLGQFRSVLAGRRLLVVLDDARDVDQVRPLVPGSRSCGTLVAGRRGLLQLREARLTVLGGLTNSDALNLLSSVVGPERLAREPDAVGPILAACDGVPLAVFAVGARLAARPAWSLGRVADLLADGRHHLDELDYGQASVRAALESAYRDVLRTDAFAAHVLRLLGRRASASVTVAEVAALIGRATADADAALESLAAGRPVLSPAPGQYLLPALARLSSPAPKAADPAL